MQREAVEILNYWFAPEQKARWFDSSDAFDREITERFGALHARAQRGEFADWESDAESVLALIILLDQFPRNMYRGTAAAFASDAQALAIAMRAVKAGFDQQLTQEQRRVLYMPLMHSEELVMQQQGVALFDALGQPESRDYMRRHRDVIARFGRFPHRNAILGRESTPEEIAFLKLPNSSF